MKDNVVDVFMIVTTLLLKETNDVFKRRLT